MVLPMPGGGVGTASSVMCHGWVDESPGARVSIEQELDLGAQILAVAAASISAAAQLTWWSSTKGFKNGFDLAPIRAIAVHVCFPIPGNHDPGKCLAPWREGSGRSAESLRV